MRLRKLTTPQVHSPAALIGAVVGLMIQLLLFALLLRWGTTATEKAWITLLATPFTLSMLLAVGAAFSSNASFRLAAITAAFISSFSPAALFVSTILLLTLGLLYLPTVFTLSIAVILSLDKVGHIIRTLTSLICGLVAGVVFLLSYWPTITGYDDCARTTYACKELLLYANVALSLGLMGAAMLLPWITGVLFRQPSRASAAPGREGT